MRTRIPTTICPAGPTKRQPVRALRAGHPEGTEVRRAWPAADRLRRLERRHEPGGRTRARAKASGWASSSTTCWAIRRARAPARRSTIRRTLPGRGRARAPEHRAAWLGRRLVSPRLFRRRHAARIGEQHRMPDRFDRAKLVGSVRRRRCRTRAPGHAGRGSAAGAPRPGADPAARSALRQVGPGPRLHQGLRAGRAGKWRAIHPCRDLGGDGVRGPWATAARLGTHDHDQPGEPCELPAAIGDLQGGALCRRGRRLRARAPHRPRRLDLVHRLGRLDVPAHRRIPAGAAAGSRQADFAPCPAGALGGFKIHYRYRETVYHITVLRTRPAMAQRASPSTASSSKTRPFPLSTTTGNTRSR